ncbi:hypothetical protein [Achromobacter kerstersii]|uniref:hypothetical protein n=1 Tax=Achromobacter kerstersii TaxID=1353890 RepID=UPI003CFD5E98
MSAPKPLASNSAALSNLLGAALGTPATSRAAEDAPTEQAEHPYGSPADVAQRIEEYIGRYGDENTSTLLLHEALKALRMPTPAPDPAHTNAQDALDALDAQQARYRMNNALCGFSMRWNLDGDYMRCRKCKRPHIASAMEVEFNHADGCKAEGKVETHPWRTFVELLAPLTGHPAPTTVDGQDALRYRTWRDAMLCEDPDFLRAMEDAMPKPVGAWRRPTAADWNAGVDAAIAALGSHQKADA